MVLIHQIWIGNNERPDVWMKTVKEFCSIYGHTYILWDNTNIPLLINSNKFNKEHTLMGKADILRYEILYSYGGIYVDADSVIINGTLLNTMIINFFSQTNEILFGKDTHDFIANGVIFSKKESPFLKKIIDYIGKLEESQLTENKPWIKYGSYLITDIYNTDPYDSIELMDQNVFYPFGWSWSSIESLDYHKSLTFPPESVMFQYGYATNNLQR